MPVVPPSQPSTRLGPRELTRPSPHTLILQSAVQSLSSPFSDWPRSHCSPGSTMPLPHARSERQSGPQFGPGGSQTSPICVSTTPLPQLSVDLQFDAQPSPPTVLPSSQASPQSLMLLPQISIDVQSSEQPSQLSSLPSSQISPPAALRTPSPHDSLERQSAEQPSPSMMLPSSHVSPGATTPLPQSF